MIVESKDVGFRKMEVHQTPSGRELVLLGLVFHSGMAVSKIDVLNEDDSVVLVVHLTVARPGLSGTIDQSIPLAPNVRRVLFGLERKAIWP